MSEMTGVNVETEHESEREKKIRRRLIALTVFFASVGVVWDVLAAAVLFHTYTFFESVVVCLLVMILCVIATLRIDFELSSGIFRRPQGAQDNGAERSEPDILEQVRAFVKGIFYAIAFIMALIKLVMTLIG